MKIAAICDKDTATGMQLAGIKETYVSDGDDVKIWHQISERDDIGILFITERIVERLEREIRAYQLKNNIPIIVEIPDKRGRKKDHTDYISHLIKKAVGVELNK